MPRHNIPVVHHQIAICTPGFVVFFGDFLFLALLKVLLGIIMLCFVQGLLKQIRETCQKDQEVSSLVPSRSGQKTRQHGVLVIGTSRPKAPSSSLLKVGGPGQRAVF